MTTPTSGTTPRLGRYGRFDHQPDTADCAYECESGIDPCRVHSGADFLNHIERTEARLAEERALLKFMLTEAESGQHRTDRSGHACPPMEQVIKRARTFLDEKGS